jgi:hypothetical protein
MKTKLTNEQILYFLTEFKSDLYAHDIEKVALFGSYGTQNQNGYSTQAIFGIKNIIEEKGPIVLALKDEQNDRAAIPMHLTAISELRNFIAHDYEVMETRLPLIKESTQKTWFQV